MTAKQWLGYASLLAVCLIVSLAAGWTTLGAQFDNDIYDFLFRLQAAPSGQAASVILGMDEQSLRMGKLGDRRRILAEGVERLAALSPKVVVVDILLMEESSDPEQDTRLAAAFAKVPNLVLATGLARTGWEDPQPAFARAAAAIGHVHADPDIYDNVVRRIPLEKAAHHRRFWAVSLEALRLARGGAPVLEEPDAIEVAGIRIPGRREEARSMLVRYRSPREPYTSSIPEVTFHQLHSDPKAAERLRGKVVFIGITAESAAEDRHMTPYSFGRTMPGVEIHANAFETLASGAFLAPANNGSVVAFCLLLAGAAGFVFARFAGWTAYLLAGAILVPVHVAPWAAFRWMGVVFPYAPPLSTAWLTMVAAAAYQHFFVRRLLGRTQAEKERYQKAIQFVAHEMRTPLTAIQGSSELLGRYKLPEEKRAEMAKMINSESKRLARMIQAFLDVERLTAGQIEMKREPFEAREVVETCLGRIQPVAESKKIRVLYEPLEAATVTGDRELMEYAVYNLLTNAVKYSPVETEVTVGGRLEGGALRLWVRDQGMGMDEQEVRNIFTKFYRTRKAESSGEAGTGIGLSLVEQIVAHHEGKIEVASTPGAGSCFTIIVSAVANAAVESKRPN